VGNTLYGELPRRAPEPADVRPYQAERYVPPTQVTVLPRPLGTCVIPQAEYPPEALRLGLEGKVILRLLIETDGRIADARVVEDPGHGFGAAAAQAVTRHCRFAAGRRGADDVATWIRYTVRFEAP
jgi:protein TonB